MRREVGSRNLGQPLDSVPGGTPEDTLSGEGRYEPSGGLGLESFTLDSGPGHVTNPALVSSSAKKGHVSWTVSSPRLVTPH